MSWNQPATFFEDEDEEALKAEYIRLSALYPTEDMFAIASYVFRNQVDPDLRCQQAAMIWNKDLSVKERIRQARLNGGKEPELLTKESLQAKILAVTEDEMIDYRQKKAMIDGYLAYAELNGWKIKAVDKTINDKTAKNLPTFVFAQYPDG